LYGAKTAKAIDAEFSSFQESGGYIFSSDHSVPSSVSLKDFQRIIKLAKEVGTYWRETGKGRGKEKNCTWECKSSLNAVIL